MITLKLVFPVNFNYPKHFFTSFMTVLYKLVITNFPLIINDCQQSTFSNKQALFVRLLHPVFCFLVDKNASGK